LQLIYVSASQQSTSSLPTNFPFFLVVPKVHYFVQRNPRLSPLLVQNNPVHIFIPCFFKNHLNILLTFTHGSPKLSLPCSKQHTWISLCLRTCNYQFTRPSDVLAVKLHKFGLCVTCNAFFFGHLCILFTKKNKFSKLQFNDLIFKVLAVSLSTVTYM
jgi:hypothetical protein